jgi:hypothetical protein
MWAPLALILLSSGQRRYHVQQLVFCVHVGDYCGIRYPESMDDFSKVPFIQTGANEICCYSVMFISQRPQFSRHITCLGEKICTYRGLVGKPDRQRLLVRRRCRQDNTKILVDLHCDERMCADLYGSGRGPVAANFEHLITYGAP